MTMDELIAKGPREVALFFGGSIQTPLHDFGKFLEEMFPDTSDEEIEECIGLAKSGRTASPERIGPTDASLRTGGTDAEAAARRAWRLVLDAAGEALTTPGLPPDDRADLLDLWRGAAEIAQRPCLSLLSRAGGPLR